MHNGAAAERAQQPEDLDRLFLERANAGDVDGVVALYEPQAVLAFPAGRLAIGARAIREAYADLLAGQPRFTGVIRPAIRNGDIAVTSTTRAGDATVRVGVRPYAVAADRQGAWVAVLGQPLMDALPGGSTSQLPAWLLRLCGIG